eukprot:sb/3474285/
MKLTIEYCEREHPEGHGHSVPETSKQPIRTRYLDHVTGYQPIREQYSHTTTNMIDLSKNSCSDLFIQNAYIFSFILHYILYVLCRGIHICYFNETSEINCTETSSATEDYFSGLDEDGNYTEIPYIMLVVVWEYCSLIG